MKIIYSDPKSGRSAQVDLPKDKVGLVLNYKIGDTIDGSIVGLAGYKLKITGGSDNSGFPLHKSIQGSIKTHIFKRANRSGKSKGIFTRNMIRGNTINQDVEQLNTVIVEYGSKDPSEIFPKGADGSKAPETAA
jgi:small subunit ribosomal protein S6e